ncbi:MAG: ATP-binding cassette domain-containing protein [Bacteroidota bacterium]
MSQSFIDALMHFFSLLLLPIPGRKVENVKDKLEDYITKAGISFPVEECLKIFNTYSGKYFIELSSNAYTQVEDMLKIQRHLILEAGQKSQENLYLQERILSILSLFEFNKIKNDNDEVFFSHIKDLGRSLNISDQDLKECEDFIYGNIPEDSKKELIVTEKDLSEELEGEWVKNNIPDLRRDIIDSLREKIVPDIRFHYFGPFYFIAFIYNGTHKLFINENRTYSGYFYSFRRKDILHFEGYDSISFDEIEEHFGVNSQKIVLSGKDLTYKHEKTKYSIKKFSFYEESGQIIGIVGNNGVGKSTILKLISNQIDPLTGELCINGSNVIKNSYRLKPLMGYVPHADIEFPGLSIYENLLYQAHLSLGNMNMSEIKRRVNNTLESWFLSKIKHVRAGTFIDHSISDFQRICLRIAIEMIRNPYILLLDEPLSGLSFSDSKRLLSLLKDETQKGRLVILTSQLPTSEFFNMFDKVWLIDSDGYMIFNGPPMASLSFFRNTGLLPYYYIQSKSDTVSAEEVIKVVETKKINSDGSISDERQIDPGTWYDAWRAESDKEFENIDTEEKPLPIYGSALPGIEKQFMVYLLRNFKKSLSNIKFLLYNILGVPAAGVIMALIIRYAFGGQYIFAENDFLPLFLFLSINLILLTSMFMGGEEIFSEKSQLHRDLSFNLSPFSYFNAKMTFVFILSFMQAFLYTIFTNMTLGLHGVTDDYLFIYFSVAAFGNLLSLSFSHTFRKLSTIYIFIPFFLIPNLLFTGYLIPFNQTSYSKNYNESVPLIANVFPTRWAYEVLMVEQFKNNPYNQYFFEEKKKHYHSEFVLNMLIPTLNEELNKSLTHKYLSPDENQLAESLNLIKHEFILLAKYDHIAPYEKILVLNPMNYDSTLYNETFGYLTYLRFLMENIISETEAIMEEKKTELSNLTNGMDLEDYRSHHVNHAVRYLVEAENVREEIIIKKGELIKKGSPVYIRPESIYGRSHYYASEKRFNNQYLSINRFNMTAIWILNLLLYILLLSDGLNSLRNLFRD